MIALNHEQMAAVKKGEAIHVVDTDLGGAIVLLREEEFQRLQQLAEDAEDQKVQAAFLEASHRSAVAFAKENPY